MTLPASGTITWNQICTEFSLNPVTAVWPTNFYGKGGAPASGNLGFADFYGRSAGGAYTPVPGTYTYWDDGAIGGGPGGSALITSVSGSVAWSYTISGFAATSSISSGSSAASISFSVPQGTGIGVRTSTITLTQGANTWNLTVKATGADSGGGGTCVTADSLILMGDGTEKRAGDLLPGDIVMTQHELTGEWGRYELIAVSFTHDPVYAMRGYPTATARHRFGYRLFGIRWFRAGWFGRYVGTRKVAKITVMAAHTYMARSPEPGSKWRLCHNLKP